MKRRNFLAISISIFCFPFFLIIERKKLIIRDGWILKEDDINEV